VDNGTQCVANEAMVVIPSYWKTGAKRRSRRILSIGKEFPAPKEEELLDKEGHRFAGKPFLPMLNLSEYGKYGIAICYDLSDLRRAWSYRGKIDHLLVLAYNRDITSFKGFADAFSRSIYCGVAICNTGFYGGTNCVLPFQAAHQRVLYCRDGSGFLSAQTVEFPLKGWREARQGAREKGPCRKPEDIYKPAMAGYKFRR